MSTTASAPGKLMLSGEYAVAVAGAPAVACSIDRRLTVHLTAGGSGWRVSSAAFGLNAAPVASVPVLAALIESVAPANASGHIVIESDLGAGAHKPGFGSSAALVVAAGGAISRAFDTPLPELSTLISAHREGQGGGSGYDIATALHGGVCRFQSRGDAHEVSALRWPEGLYARVIGLGRGASTPSQIANLDTALHREPARVGEALDAQVAAAVATAHAFAGDGVVLGLLSRSEEALRALDRAARLGIVNPDYVAVAAAIFEAGGVLRTAGAGGGDSVWLFASDEPTIEVALAAVTRAGYGALDVRPDERGLEIEGVSP